MISKNGRSPVEPAAGVGRVRTMILGGGSGELRLRGCLSYTALPPSAGDCPVHPAQRRAPVQHHAGEVAGRTVPDGIVLPAVTSVSAHQRCRCHRRPRWRHRYLSQIHVAVAVVIGSFSSCRSPQTHHSGESARRGPPSGCRRVQADLCSRWLLTLWWTYPTESPGSHVA